MQIAYAQRECQACGAASLQFSAVLHHMTCAYVGPDYDFAAAAGGFCCPKCKREIAPGDAACEVVGISARCNECQREMVVSHPPA